MLNERIRALRRKQKMSQEDLATRVGCDRVTISHYEHGRSIPPLYMAQKLAQVFNVTMDELLKAEANGQHPLEAPRSP